MPGDVLTHAYSSIHPHTALAEPCIQQQTFLTNDEDEGNRNPVSRILLNWS